MVFSLFPCIYMEVLGRYAFIAEKELQGVVDELISAAELLGETLGDAIHGYKYDVFKEANRVGIPLPSDAVEILRLGEEKEHEDKMQGFPVHPDLIKDFSECPMMQEVRDIQLGRWSGKPHWMIDNC
jgi:hypothetical protein